MNVIKLQEMVVQNMHMPVSIHYCVYRKQVEDSSARLPLKQSPHHYDITVLHGLLCVVYVSATEVAWPPHPPNNEDKKHLKVLSSENITFL